MKSVMETRLRMQLRSPGVSKSCEESKASGLLLLKDTPILLIHIHRSCKKVEGGRRSAGPQTHPVAFYTEACIANRSSANTFPPTCGNSPAF